MKKYTHGKCVFQNGWLDDLELKPWIMRGNDLYSAKCRYCPGANISLSSMGRQALTSHTKSKKHTQAISMAGSPNLGCFFKSDIPAAISSDKATRREGRNDTTVPESTPGPGLFGNDTEFNFQDNTPSTSTRTATIESNVETRPVLGTTTIKQGRPHILNKYFLDTKVTEAEVTWTLHSICTHRSNRAAAKDIKVLKHLFPENEVIQKMQLERTKIGYLTVFGLAPYFKQEMINEIHETCKLNGYFVLSFDESLNKVSQSQQMDVVIRYWDLNKNQVTTRYFTSAFLKKATAADLLKSFLAAVNDLDLRNLIQISMDGPNVNKKFLKDLQNHFSDDLHFEHKMLNLGSCGLHTLHNAFKAAITITGWNLIPFLRAIYNFFKDHPARRGTYTQVTGSTLFPKKFCSVRWLENEDVAKTAITIIPCLKKFVAAQVINKSAPTTQSFTIIQQGLKNPLLGAKLAFFKTLSSDVQPLLGFFQSDLPLAPFLYTSLKSLIQTEMERFVVSEKINPTSAKSLLNENMINSSKINIGIGAKAEIGKSKDELTVLMVNTFKHECRNALKCFVERLIEKSPLNYEATKFITSLDPDISHTSLGHERFEKLAILMSSNLLISSETAEQAQREFKILCSQASTELKQFKKFKDASENSQKTQTRLDLFWMSLLKTSGLENSALARVIKNILILSHGNAAVERGFSINKECLVENMKETSLISMRTCFDVVDVYGGVEKVPTSKSLILSCKNAAAKYKEALKKQKEEEDEEAQKRANKRRNQLLVRELEEKKRKILEEARMEAEKIGKTILNLENL